MFPGTTVRSSSGERVLATVGAAADIVVATVGAEPVADEGYAAVVVLDTDRTVLHTQLTDAIGEEPDYDAAVSALG